MAETLRNWPEVELGEVCEFAYGKSLPATARSGSGFPVFGSNGLVGFHEEALTDGETIIIGRKGSFGEVHFSEQPCSPIDTTYYITNHQTNAYLPWLTRCLQSLNLKQLNRAAAIPGLNRADAYRQKLLLPPLAEQKRIAAILDAADALRAKRRETLAQLDTLLQSTFLDMFGDPVTNPKGWEVVSFDRIGKFTSGATPSKMRDDYWRGSVPWVSPKDMKVTRIVDSKDHVSDLALKETNLKLLAPGNLLIVVRGMILTHSFPVAINVVPVTINQDMNGIIPSPRTEVFFLSECLRPLTRQILSEVSTAGHGTKRFDAEAMKKILVPLPPLPLQRRFAAIVESVEQQKTRLRAHLTELDTLLASLQDRAFKGAL